LPCTEKLTLGHDASLRLVLLGETVLVSGGSTDGSRAGSVGRETGRSGGSGSSRGNLEVGSIKLVSRSAGLP
jgi:hypothetical protein